MDQPFNRPILYPLEKPFADDVNAGFSEGDRSLRHSLFWLLNGQSGFLRGGFQVVPSTPAALSVVMKAGQAFFDAPTDTPSNIGGVVGLNDLSRYKPLVLGADLTINVPTPPGANSRIDLIEVAYLRQSDNSQSRNFLNTGTNQFAPALVAKTLDFNVDASLGFFAAAATPNTAIAYKSGVVAGSPVSPAVDSGYMAVAKILVTAGAATIIAANIADARIPILLGQYLGRQIFTGGGTYTPTPGTARVRVRMVGGGGGSGGVAAAAANQASVTGGGASGAYLELNIPPTGIGPVVGGAVVIGAAGNGGGSGNNPGTAGGDTQVTVNGVTFTAKGGGGSGGGSGHDAFINGGGTIPAGSSAADVQSGQPGSFGVGISGTLTSSVSAGNGGSNPFGQGGAGGVNAVGGAPSGFGAGGGGSSDTVAAAHAGQQGSAGLVVIDEWS